MSRFAAILFSILTIVYLGFLIAGMINILPWGLIGLAALAAFAFLFLWILRDRMGNEEDDYYDKNVEK